MSLRACEASRLRGSEAYKTLTERDRGFFGRGDMQKEFEDVAFSLKPGEVSSVVDTASGVHLIERYMLLHRRCTALRLTKLADSIESVYTRVGLLYMIGFWVKSIA